MSESSINPSSKEYFDGAPIGVAITEAPTDVFDADDCLEEDNDILKNLFDGLDAVIEDSCPALKT